MNCIYYGRKGSNKRSYDGALELQLYKGDTEVNQN